MSKVYFVVTETNFEYNDEHHSVSGDGGKPVAVFNKEEDAKEDAAKRSVRAIRDYGSDMIAGFIYGHGFDWTFKTCPSFFPEGDIDYDNIEDALNIKNLTEEQLVELEVCLNIKFFTYTKV